MSGGSRAFSKRGAVDVETVAAALQPRFTLAPGEERAISRTWLDTFDWRLHAAGISLEYVDGGPLVALTARRSVLGDAANRWLTTALAVAAAVLLSTLKVALVVLLVTA